MELAGGRQMAFYVWKCDPVTGRIRVLGENFTLFEVTIILDAFPSHFWPGGHGLMV